MSKVVYPPPNIINKRFGKLTVISNAFIKRKNKKTELVLTTKCDCGFVKDVAWVRLRKGITKSCGNHRSQTTTETRTIHGLSRHPLNSTWSKMKGRCYTTSYQNYKNYGGRGISICDEWHNDFKTFYDWCILNGYEKGLTIERINNDGNYEPSNCKFIPQSLQPRNTRITKLNELRVKHIRLLHANKIKTAKELSYLYGVCPNRIHEIVSYRAWI